VSSPREPGDVAEAGRVAAAAPAIRREMGFVAGYFGLLLAYLFVHQEGEVLHWLSLVLLPLLGLSVAGRYASPRGLLRSVGLDEARAGRGLWAVLSWARRFRCCSWRTTASASSSSRCCASLSDF
jgi:hypothetical protein